MKRGSVIATAVIKILVLYQIVVKRNAKFIKPALTVISLDINKNVTLAQVKTFKGRFGNHKMSFNHVKHKNDTNLSK